MTPTHSQNRQPIGRPTSGLTQVRLAAERFTRRWVRRSICGLTAVFLITQIAANVSAQSTVNLQNAVYRMNAWLSGSEHAAGWRKYLHLNLLDTQAALGDQADLLTLQKIDRQFNSNVDGLDAVEFDNVRRGLQQQIELLSSAIGVSPLALAQEAHGHYRPISIADLQHARDAAVYDLGLLKKYYRSTMPSRPRADLFYDLQLNEQVAFLQGLEFELPPKISVGKTTSQINDERERLKEIEAKIDALPVADQSQERNDQANSSRDDSLLLPPEPDNGEITVDELKERRSRIKKRIDELKEMRLDLAEKDRDRVTKRKSVLRQLAVFNRSTEAVALKKFDPYFLSAALTTERFNFLYFYGTDDNLQQEFLSRVKALQENLNASADMSDRKTHAELGKLIQWFESANQLPELVSAVRAKFSNPNAYLGVSSGMINQIAGQDVSQRQRIKQTIFGRIIRGVANTNGSVQVQLTPDPNQANVSIRLLGSITSQTYTRERKFRIDVSASGNYHGHRDIYANVGGFYAGLAEVNACIYSSFGGISTNIGLIQKLAAKTFAEGKARADFETSRRTREQILEMFENQTDDALADGRQQFNKLQQRLIDKQALIPATYLRTGGDKIEIVAIKQNQGSLAAASRPIQFGVTRDVQATIHETMLSNFTDPIFAGKTFTNKELQAEAAKRFGVQPPALDPGEDSVADANAIEEEQFSITFSRVRPIQFEFEGDRFAITVTGVRFAQEGRAIRAGLQFRVQFKIQNVNGQLELRRDGPAEIEYLDPDKKDAKIVAFRSLLEKKLNQGLKDDQGFPLPRNLIPVDKLADAEVAEKLVLSQLRFENGWAYVGWEYAPNGYPSLPSDISAIVYSPGQPELPSVGENPGPDLDRSQADSDTQSGAAGAAGAAGAQSVLEGDRFQGQIYIAPAVPR